MQLSDPRKRKDYLLKELVMGGVMLFVFKDGNLPSVHEEIALLPGSARQNRERLVARKKGQIKQQRFEWANNIGYCGFSLSVIECRETTVWAKSEKTEQRTFTHISSIPVDYLNYFQISDGGRMRWRIENSFDYLKEHGYNLGHKFSRVSFNAFKNYYQCMMLAHMINQFVEKSTEIIQLLNRSSKSTIVNLWKRLLAYFTEVDIQETEYEQFVRKRHQVRLA